MFKITRCNHDSDGHNLKPAICGELADAVQTARLARACGYREVAILPGTTDERELLQRLTADGVIRLPMNV